MRGEYEEVPREICTVHGTGTLERQMIYTQDAFRHKTQFFGCPCMGMRMDASDALTGDDDS